MSAIYRFSFLITLWTQFSSVIASKNFMLVADSTKHKIYQISLDNGNIIRDFFAHLSTGVYYDEDNDYVYFADYQGRRIVQTTLSNFSNQAFYNTGEGMPERLVIDTSTGHIYYTANVMSSTKNASYIAVFDPKSKVHRKLIMGLNRPRALALYPSKGLMFWTDYGRGTSHIGRGYMDGSWWSVLSNTTVNPHGIAIDYKEDRLYWGDAHHSHIVSTDLEGNDLKIVLEDEGAYIEDLILQDPFLYYTASNKRTIIKIVKSTGKEISWINKTTIRIFGRLQDIDIVPKDIQPVSAQCKDGNGLCSTFCLPKPTGYTCSCRDNMPLTGDGLTCRGVTRCELSIPNGKLSSVCLGFPNKFCEYSCSAGYVKSKGIRRILCLDSGHWSYPATQLCTEDTSYVSTSSISLALKLAASLGGVALLLSIIGLIILLVYIFVSRKKKSVFVHGASAIRFSSNSDLGNANNAFENNVYALENNEISTTEYAKTGDL